jgi:hypothetical protein
LTISANCGLKAPSSAMGAAATTPSPSWVTYSRRTSALNMKENWVVQSKPPQVCRFSHWLLRFIVASRLDSWFFPESTNCAVSGGAARSEGNSGGVASPPMVYAHGPAWREGRLPFGKPAAVSAAASRAICWALDHSMLS